MLMSTIEQPRNNSQALEFELDRLQRSYNWISDSFAFTGHEIRNGLLRLRLMTEKLQREIALNDMKQETVERVSECAQMLELVALNCLRLAEMDEPRFAPAPALIDPLVMIIRPLLGSYKEMLEFHQQTCEIRIESACSLMWADPDLLRLAINNLLNNAIKYGERGGRIVISLAESSHGMDEITVWNSGMGIPPQDMQHIFGRFETGGKAGVSDSTGIGLYLVERIVEAHGGFLYCESVPDEWVRFGIRLPREHSSSFSTLV